MTFTYPSGVSGSCSFSTDEIGGIHRNLNSKKFDEVFNEYVADKILHEAVFLYGLREIIEKLMTPLYGACNKDNPKPRYYPKNELFYSDITDKVILSTILNKFDNKWKELIKNTDEWEMSKIELKNAYNQHINFYSKKEEAKDCNFTIRTNDEAFWFIHSMCDGPEPNDYVISNFIMLKKVRKFVNILSRVDDLQDYHSTVSTRPFQFCTREELEEVSKKLKEIDKEAKAKAEKEKNEDEEENKIEES